MDIVIRQALPDEYAPLGEITAQAYLQDGLLDFGESDEYLGELRMWPSGPPRPTYLWPWTATSSSAA